MKPIWTAVALTALTLLSASYVLAQPGDTVTVHHAWTTPTLTSHGNAAVYMTVQNPGSKAMTIVGAHSPVAERVELHNTSTSSDGISRMNHVMQAEVPPGGNLYFKPGGLHVMLFGLKHKLAEGNTLPLTLEFRRQGTVSTTVEVRPLASKVSDESSTTEDSLTDETSTPLSSHEHHEHHDHAVSESTETEGLATEQEAPASESDSKPEAAPHKHH